MSDQIFAVNSATLIVKACWESYIFHEQIVELFVLLYIKGILLSKALIGVTDQCPCHGVCSTAALFFPKGGVAP